MFKVLLVAKSAETLRKAIRSKFPENFAITVAKNARRALQEVESERRFQLIAIALEDGRELSKLTAVARQQNPTAYIICQNGTALNRRCQSIPEADTILMCQVEAAASQFGDAVIKYLQGDRPPTAHRPA